jgi:hypothetical protein
MAKRDNETKRSNGDTKMTSASESTTADAMEQQVLAFAEQVGRIVGTFQARAEGWMDRETLNNQIASVRDGAADLLARRVCLMRRLGAYVMPSRSGPIPPVRAT